MRRRGTGSSRNGRIAIAAAVLASVLIVAVGGGYSGSRALLADGVAFAVDGAGLDRLNAATNSPDAEILDLAKGSGRIRSVHRDGRLYVVDTATNTVSQVDPATLEVGPTTPARPGLAPDQVTVVTGGGTSALVDRGSSTIQRLDQDTLAPLGPPVAVDGGLANAVVDADGVIWVATREAGTIVRITPDSRAEPVPVAVQGSPLAVTLVGGRPVAADTEAGAVVAIDASSLKRSEVARLAQPPAGDLIVSGPDSPAPYLWLVDSGSDALFRVDLRTGRVDGPLPLGAGDLEWGQPVVQGSRVYAPNLVEHTLAVVDAETLTRVDEVRVPGAGADFDLTLQGGVLWANDPTSGTAVVVDREGTARAVDKGEGRGRPAERQAEADPPEPPTERVPAPLPPAPPRAAPPQVVAPAADAVVPDVADLPRIEACAALAAVGLGCQSTERDGGRIGRVAGQDPRAGTTLRPGASVRVVVGLGVKVPKAEGVSRDAACSDLASRRLQCVAQSVTLERGKVRGDVFEQQPPAGQRADEGSGVRIRYWGDPRRLPVPIVKGQPQAAACAALAAATLVCQVRDGGRGENPGTVADQVPAGGAQADEGSTVVLDIPSAPPQARVPDVGASAPGAGCAAIQSAGFTCRADDAGPGSPAGQVVGQQPPAGTIADKGTLVVLTYHGTTPPPPPPPPPPVAPPTKVELRRYKASGSERYRVAVPGTQGGGWVDDGLLGYCYVSATEVPGMVPLLQYQKPTDTSYYRHRVATDPLGPDWGDPKGICWVFPPPGKAGGPATAPPGQKPLLSMMRRGNSDLWFWTQSLTVWERGGPNGDYIASGVTAYLAT